MADDCVPLDGAPLDGAPLDGAPLDVARLVHDHHQALYGYAFRLTGSAADAEDLTQQVYLVAQQKSGQVREASQARAWLFTVLRNCYLKSFRRPTPVTAARLGLDLDTIPQNTAEQEIDAERLQLVLNELPEEFKLVVLMFYFEERSYREIAEQLELPPGTVMSRLSRAKGHLRRRLLEPERNQARGATPGGNGETLRPTPPPAFRR